MGIHSDLKETGEKSGLLVVTACVTSLNGEQHVQHTLEAEVEAVADAEALGEKLASILKETGAKAILDEINADRAKRIGETKTEEEVQNIESTMEGTAAA